MFLKSKRVKRKIVFVLQCVDFVTEENESALRGWLIDGVVVLAGNCCHLFLCVQFCQKTQALKSLDSGDFIVNGKCCS